MLGLLMQWGGTFWGGGYTFVDLLQMMQQYGFFAYVLPFLLIFALIYAILVKIEIFKDNKGAAIIIAIAIGLLSLQFNYVTDFFSVIFPNLGIGLSLLLCAIILAGAFIPGETSFKWIFFGLGAIIFLIVALVSFSNYRFQGSWEWTGWWNMYGGIVFFLLIFAGVIVAVVVANKK